jgi:hypothetical protein
VLEVRVLGQRLLQVLLLGLKRNNLRFLGLLEQRCLVASVLNLAQLNITLFNDGVGGDETLLKRFDLCGALFRLHRQRLDLFTLEKQLRLILDLRRAQ